MVKVEKVSQRQNRRQSSRYGVSLVAGHPFSQETISGLTKLQKTISNRFPEAFAHVVPKHLHLTILRSKSSKRELDELSPPGGQFENLLINRDSPELFFSTTKVGDDGAVRVYVGSTNSVISEDVGNKLARMMGKKYGYNTRLQGQFWVTLADLRESYVKSVDTNWISTNVKPVNIDSENVSHLSLVYYRDVHFNDTTLIKRYSL
jgi:hypothetical protein